MMFSLVYTFYSKRQTIHFFLPHQNVHNIISLFLFMRKVHGCLEDLKFSSVPYVGAMYTLQYDIIPVKMLVVVMRVCLRAETSRD